MKKQNWRIKPAVTRALRDWYGSERAKTEILPHLPGTVRLSEKIDKVMSAVISPSTLKLMELKEQWESIAGPQIAGIAAPQSIRNKVVYVEVSHSLWMAELRGSSKKILLEKINGVCGKDFCSDIRFIPTGRNE